MAAKKLVIKASVAAPTKPAPKQYQWHWHRIGLAVVTTGCLVTALGYGVSHHVVANEQTPVMVSVQEAHTDAMQNSTADARVADQEAQVLELDPPTEPEPEEPVAEVEGEVAAMQEPELEPEPELEAESEPQSEFAQSADVAHVALGAKFDANSVSRSLLTTNVVKREPVDVLKDEISLSQFEQKLFFFTEVKNMQGRFVEHVWAFEGQELARVRLSISAPRHRTYSSKNIMPSQTGQWRVTVVDDEKRLLAEKTFSIVAN